MQLRRPASKTKRMRTGAPASAGYVEDYLALQPDGAIIE